MKKLVLILVLASVLVAISRAEGPPPGDLHLVDDHWTAWDPPTSFPEGTAVHTIVPGDTFWSLAERFYGDPYLWPQIWEENRYVLDAHWIYPGDPLVIPNATTETGETIAADVAAPPIDSEMADTTPVDAADDPFPELEGLGSGPGGGRSDAPVALGHESDIYCSGYIGDLEEEFPYTIVGSEYEFLTPTLDPQRGSELTGLYGKTDTQKYGLGMSDVVYLDSGSEAGLSAGETLSAVAAQQRIVHPLTDELMGRLYRYLGRVRVLSVQESSAIGEIVHSCHPMPVGTTLKLFEPEPVPLRRMTAMRPVNYPAPDEALDGAPAIILTHEQVVLLGRGSLVYLDRGFEDDVAPGDVFTIYRRGRRGFPPIVLGELGVLSVQRSTALGRILDSRYSIFVGDALQPK